MNNNRVFDTQDSPKIESKPKLDLTKFKSIKDKTPLPPVQKAILPIFVPPSPISLCESRTEKKRGLRPYQKRYQASTGSNWKYSVIVELDRGYIRKGNRALIYRDNDPQIARFCSEKKTHFLIKSGFVERVDAVMFAQDKGFSL